MKTLVSILAVAVIAVAVTISFAPDAQLMSNEQLDSFVGACCVETNPSGYWCNNYDGNDVDFPSQVCTNGCWDMGVVSEKYVDPNNFQQKVCQVGGDNPDGCDMSGHMNCGTDGETLRLYDQWEGNDWCNADPDREDVPSFHKLPHAIGDNC